MRTLPRIRACLRTLQLSGRLSSCLVWSFSIIVTSIIAGWMKQANNKELQQQAMIAEMEMELCLLLGRPCLLGLKPFVRHYTTYI